MIRIYTDGSCYPNPGPGGWAAILTAPGRDNKEISGAALDTTNNRMEMRAAIEGLCALRKRCQVELYTDSRYLSNAFVQGWVVKWERNGWMTSERTKVKNQDLWLELSELVERHEVVWKWLKGHNGHPLNERADVLARHARTMMVEGRGA